MHRRSSLDDNVLSMDCSACQFLDNDDLFRSGSYSFYLLGEAAMVERCPD